MALRWFNIAMNCVLGPVYPPPSHHAYPPPPGPEYPPMGNAYPPPQYTPYPPPPPPQPAPCYGHDPHAAAPPPAGYPVMVEQHGHQHQPVAAGTQSKGDGFWKGCAAALCCCFAFEVCCD
ncbi:unnamed protein product [Linum trigynum]|uniref:Cysteine-rich transmembrane domain-containing protein n=1 Tax=Linum trigynum TaxID=586398 RepID=A0AAV2GGY4_9ROSI